MPLLKIWPIVKFKGEKSCMIWGNAVLPLIENGTILLNYKFKTTSILSMMLGKLTKGFTQKPFEKNIGFKLIILKWVWLV